MPRKKADIIEQLEKGKELLESGEIDVESLKTKVESENEEVSEKPKRKRRTSKNNNNVSGVRDIDNDKDNGCSSDRNNINNTVSSDDSSRKPDEPRVEKYPGFDFTTMYSKGQVIFYVKVNELIGEKELQELKLRTIYPKMLVGCLEKAYTQCIGPDTADRIFTNRYDAVQCYDSINIKQRIYKSTGEVEEDE